jgi:hypothetical protein
MKWLQKAYRHQLSEDRRYAVCAIGQGQGVFFEAWRSGKHEDGLLTLKSRDGRTKFETAEQARNCCQEYESGQRI